MLAEEKAAHRAAIDRIPVSPGITHEIVRQYLLHYGYEDTLRAFDEAAGLIEEAQQPATAVEGDAASAAFADPAYAASALVLRSRLRSCLMAGDVDGALSLLSEHCPVVMSDAKRFGEVHFQLACQKYIELVRCGRVEEAVQFAQSTMSQLRGPSPASMESSLRDVVALVAYQNPEASPLAHLLGREQRDAVADAVNAAVLTVASEAGGLPASPSAAAAGSERSWAGLQLRPAAATPPRPASRVETLLQQLVAVQGALHEANGGQGWIFNLQDYMLGPTQ
ncbi:hypothetical protein Vafri_17192 [Volvox africanus]|nr:hypothetical protein Vafri_17192 [Volvox africanus]